MLLLILCCLVKCPCFHWPGESEELRLACHEMQVPRLAWSIATDHFRLVESCLLTCLLAASSCAELPLISLTAADSFKRGALQLICLDW